MISEPSLRISACSRPTALLAASSERKELEQTSSAQPSVRCASVIRCGRISCSTTGMPALAICQAASEPARPAPTTWTGPECDLGVVMARRVSAFWQPAHLRRGFQRRQRPHEAGAIRSFRAERVSAVVGAGCNARNVRTIEADVGQFAVAELGQFGDVALIIPERLDQADEREQHW